MSRASRPFSLMVPPEIFLLVTQARMSFSEALVVRGISGRSRTRSKASLWRYSRLSSRSRHDVAGCAALEDAVEAGAQDAGLLRAGRPLVLLQATIEPPDHPLGDLDGVALLVVGGKELVDKAFGMNPAQRMDADAELAGVVGNNDGVRQQPLMADRAPQRTFAGDQNWIGVTFSSVRPSACKCRSHASGDEKIRCSS